MKRGLRVMICSQYLYEKTIIVYSFIMKFFSWLKKQRLLITMIIVLSIPIVVYVLRFGRYQISTDPSDWADFGSYIGGVYTIVVSVFAIYLTRHLDRKDAAWKNLQNAVGAIFVQLSKIDYTKVNLKNVSKLLQIVHENELYIPPDLYVMLLDLHDDYLEAKTCPEKFDTAKEIKIKARLKKLYDV